MKKIVIIVIIIIVSLFAAIFLPWDKLSGWKDKLIGGGGEVASLKIYSLGGDMKVYLDGEEKGIIRRDDPYLEIFPVDVGDHRVKLERESSTNDFYLDFEKTVKFEKGFDTVIGWEIGPSEDSSSGWILHAQKTSDDSNSVLINANCSPSDCNILNDLDEVIESPIQSKEISLDKQHSLTASKDGYQDLEVQILPEDENARMNLRGYILYLEIYLYKIPLS